MRCILHIGLMKTGTTLLQGWLYQNRKELSAQRVYLPESMGTPDHHLLTAYFQDRHDDWSRLMGMRNLEERRTFFKGFVDRVKKEIADHSKSHDVFVITAKNLNFSMTPTDDFAPLTSLLRDNFDSVKVVCTFRNQFDMAVSAYSEWVKSSTQMTLEEYVKTVSPDNYHFNYLAIADAWSSAFGRKNCEFKIFDKARFFEGDVRKDFLRSLDCPIQYDRLDFSLDSANESLAPLVAAGYRAVNSLMPTWDSINGGPNGATLEMKSRINSLPSLRKGKMVSTARTQVEALFDSVNTQFFAKYFDSPNLFKSGTDATDRRPQYSAEEVENIVFEVVRSLLPQTQQTRMLVDGDANYLRDIAVKIENKSELLLSEALALMKLAHRARPTGPFIAAKTREYELRLSAQANVNKAAS